MTECLVAAAESSVCLTLSVVSVSRRQDDRRRTAHNDAINHTMTAYSSHSQHSLVIVRILLND